MLFLLIVNSFSTEVFHPHFPVAANLKNSLYFLPKIVALDTVTDLTETDGNESKYWYVSKTLRDNMRQAKNGKTKETAKEKKQRRKEMEDIHKQVKTIVVPGLIAVFIFIVAYVYIKTRPSSYID